MKRNYKNNQVSQIYHPLQPTAPAGLGVTIQQQQFQEAVVVDVITNSDHSLYATDGYNVGTIKFRFLSDGNNRNESTLNTAFPLQSNISQYPLKGEVVYVFSSLARFWYMAIFNVSNKTTTQDLPELLVETKTPQSSRNRTDSIRSGEASPYKISNKSQINLVGKYFKDLSSVHRLRHMEGDVIFEGRSGQSIRFGSAWSSINSPIKSNTDQSPNILLRVRQTPINTTQKFQQIDEDINEDESSVWITAKQIIPLNPSTIDDRIHGFSVSDMPSKFDDNSITVNTNSIILNSRNKIFNFSRNGIHFTTKADITFDSSRDSISWINRDKRDRVVNDYIITIGNSLDIESKKLTILSTDKISIIGEHVSIGSSDTSEPMVLGTTLKNILAELLNVLVQPNQSPISASPGSPTVINPQFISNINLIKQKLDGILSESNFVSKINSSISRNRPISSYKEG